MTKIYLLLAFFLCPFLCLAQYSISGRIQVQNTNKPVSGASVYLAGATIGSESSEDGAFALKNVASGKYELIISAVGFETFRQTIQVAGANLALPVISLNSRVNALKEVTVKFDKHRDQNIELFSNEFLGTSDIAKQCKIVNPDVLNLDYDDKAGILSASTDDYLIIKNNALGYEINYLLTDFRLNNKDPLDKKFSYHGSIFFKQMDGTTDQQQEWEKNREQVYANSLMHFLRSALNNRLDDEGFRAYRIAFVPNPKRPGDDVINKKVAFFSDNKNQLAGGKDSLSYWIRKSKLSYGSQKLVPVSVNKNDIVNATNQAGIYALGCDFDGLFVAYNKHHQFTIGRNFDVPVADATVINFKAPAALFNGNGWLIDPGSLELTGEWANKRIAETLPLDYEPEEAKVDYSVFRNIAGKVKSFVEDHPPEKVYLHLDKPYYSASDTLYFKAYVTGEENKLSPLSGILHVDLLSPDNKPQQSINLQIAGGLAFGDFALPDTLVSGPYKVVAYTRLSADSVIDGSFSRVIQVIGSQQPGSRQATVVNSPIDVQFFPEGGELVSGLRSKVAFKAIGADGLGIDIKGTVTDNDDREICSFSASHLGMGFFYLQPVAGRLYKAKVIYADGITHIFKLPVSNENGIILSLENDNPVKATVVVKANRDFYKDNKGKDFTLIVSSGRETTPYVFKLTDLSYSVELENKQFRSGVVRITLFSPEGVPMNERLMFIRNTGLLNLKINSDKAQYALRDKVNIGLNAADDDGKPAQGHFSVSVVDESQVPFDNNARQTMLTDLLLASELKGYIEQPNYYFTTDPIKAQKSLDLLMLTQGYRRFAWEQVLGGVPDPGLAVQPEVSLDLEGWVKRASGAPVPGADVVLVDNPDTLVRTVRSDTNGHFMFANLVITGKPLVLISARKGDSKEVLKLLVRQSSFRMVWPGDDMVSRIKGVMRTASIVQPWDQYKRTQAAIKLKEVTIRGNVPAAPKLQHSSNRALSGQSNYIVMGDQLINCTDPSCLFGRFPGTISKNGIIYLTRTGDRFGENGKGIMSFPPPPIAVIVDGIRLPSPDYLFQILNISDIYSIELLKNGSLLTMYGSQAPGGAFIVTTRRGGENGDRNYTMKTGMIGVPFKGFYRAREFYSPKYQHNGPGSDLPDLRSTIFWAPEIKTGANGDATFDYYNADGRGKYLVIIEGIDENGNIGSQTFRYEVK